MVSYMPSFAKEWLFSFGYKLTLVYNTNLMQLLGKWNVMMVFHQKL